MFEGSGYRRKNTELTCLNQKNVDFISRVRKTKNRSHSILQRMVLNNNELSDSEVELFVRNNAERTIRHWKLNKMISKVCSHMYCISLMFDYYIINI